jgi:hypothetical protein
MASTTHLPPKTGDIVLDQWILEVHKNLFGLGDDRTGDLDDSNSPGAHDGRVGGHSELAQGTNVVNVDESEISVDTADADAVYGAAEQALINELKSDLNALVGEYNDFVSRFNSLLQSLRTAQTIT